jgi:hypothetical protein
VNTGTTLLLSPGTYVFAAMNLNFSGGTVTCVGCDIPSGTGVTLVMTGVTSGSYDPSKTGTITIGNATVTMSAPALNGPGGIFDGVLVYRDSAAGDPGCNSVSIALNAASNMAGALYFPNSCASYGNQLTNLGTSCTVIFAQTLTFPTGAAFDDTMCGTSPGTGTRYPIYNIAELLE